MSRKESTRKENREVFNKIKTTVKIEASAKTVLNGLYTFLTNSTQYKVKCL